VHSKEVVRVEGVWSSVEKLNTVGFVFRTLLVGIILYFASRYLPRRSGGQYAGYDFTFFWMMGGLIASPLYDSKINFTNTITAIVTIYITHYFISFLGVKSRVFARVVYGKEEVLIEGGQINKSGMFKSLFPIELLLAQLREVNVFNINEVHTAILETSGHVSVLKKSDHLPVTPKDLNISVVGGGLPITLINDGEIIEKNLQKIGYDKEWLKNELQKLGVMQIKDVYLASIDGEGKLFCSLSK